MLVRFDTLAVLGYGKCLSLHYILRTEKTAVFKVKVKSLNACNWVNISPNQGRHKATIAATLQLTWYF
jgi:hypothetical protein